MKKVLIGFIALISVVVLWKLTSGTTTVLKESPDKIQDTAIASKSLVAEYAPVLIQVPERFSPEVRSKLQILNEIFASKNDNDPRLDSEFKNLSPEMKEALVSSYKTMPKESLNERGTVVFLLGQKIESEKDVEFFQELLQEAPCLSLANCSQESKLENPEDDHLAESQETTLIYPQLMALRLLSLNYQESKNSALKDKIKEAFRVAQDSTSEYLGDEAKRIATEAGITE